jgi:hypothetical protein
MADRWDNIEILQAIDRRQQETYRGGPMRGVHGLYLMEQITGSMPHDQQLMRGFVQELHITRDMGLLTFRTQPDSRPNLADTDPNWYLQTISDFALTVDGQDRARSRMVVQTSRALWTSSSITYWASTRQRRRLRRSTASLTSAADSSTTIALEASPASSAWWPQNWPANGSDMTPAARASRATAATARVSRRYDPAESGRLGPGT